MYGSYECLLILTIFLVLIVLFGSIYIDMRDWQHKFIHSFPLS